MRAKDKRQVSEVEKMKEDIIQFEAIPCCLLDRLVSSFFISHFLVHFLPCKLDSYSSQFAEIIATHIHKARMLLRESIIYDDSQLDDLSFSLALFLQLV